MASVGYARVSSVGQSLDIQREKLNICDKLYEEKISGIEQNRPELKKCLDYVREGDVLVVTKLDRLARSILHLCTIAEQIRDKGVSLRVLDQNIDTNSATGRLLFNMLGAIGQFETEIRKERQMEGIKKAKNNGVKFGRRRELNEKDIKDLKEERKKGKPIREIMSKYKLSKSSVYRYLQR